MSKQQLTAASGNSDKAEVVKIQTTKLPQTSKLSPAKIQYTFYQPHLSQPPTDYMFLDDNPTLKTSTQLQTATRVEQKPGTNLQPSPNKQRLESGASRKDSYDSTDDNPELSLKSKLMEEWEVCQTQEKDSNESVKGSRDDIRSEKSVCITMEPTEQTPLSPRRCSVEGKFIPQKNQLPPSKRKPTTVERGYLLWQLQKTGDEVDHLETIMKRTVERKQLETETENVTLEHNV
ncbi:uncharacterized protein LOC128919808 isoform X1 [Zeugodacus cucurbitae]|uniref:Uncharacterized protein n=1 Tax=Zeugodacus cucurbitae TaxID=28588 RepID=A0A0A1XSJ2_ZEUCU|nr:uncharacterized protein LOC105218242 isoform X1 [Zeugodacus cucurbitae]XP_054081149.1 uncharacterized protein LOC128919808 isoform X1 [Zeugodacus cucurbitae]